MDFYKWYTPSNNFIIHDYIDEAPHRPPLKKYSMFFFFLKTLPPTYIKRLEQFNIFDLYCCNPNTIKGVSFYSKSLNLYNKELISLLRDIDTYFRLQYNEEPTPKQWKLIRTLKTGPKEEKRVSQSTVYLD